MTEKKDIPLEQMLNAPDLFHAFRHLADHPELTRTFGGRIYKEIYYPDYLTVGGASFAIHREALKHCVGHGIDVGAGYWPLPKAEPVDIWRGPGADNSLDNYPEHSLDFIFSSHCLEHIENWREALATWVVRLKLGGRIFLYLPHPDCAIWHPESPFINDGHKWIPTPDILQEALIDLNCELIVRDDGPDAMQSFYVCAQLISTD